MPDPIVKQYLVRDAFAYNGDVIPASPVNPTLVAVPEDFKPLRTWQPMPGVENRGRYPFWDCTGAVAQKVR